MIKLEGVVRTYLMGKAQVQALRGLDLGVAQGEFVAIMGPSGSGKSTLMHLIGGLDLPDAGRVLLGDLDLSRQDDDRLAELRGRRIGFVFQTFNLIPTLTALENVELPLIFQGVRGESGRGGCSSRSASGNGSITDRRSSPAGRGSGSRSPVPW